MTDISNRDSLNKIYSQAINLVRRHYERIYFQDIFLKELKEQIEELNMFSDLFMKIKEHRPYINSEDVDRFDKCIRTFEHIIYCDHVNEHVRLGIYKALAFELYRLVHGNISYKKGLEYAFEDFIAHGSIIEYLYMFYPGESKTREVGIDYVILLNVKNNENNVIIPLYIIAKMKRKDGEKCFTNLIDAIEELRNELEDNPEKNEKLLHMLDYFPEFVRITILRASKQIGMKIHKYNGYKVRIYMDFATSLLAPILYDLGEIYQRVLSDKFLRRLSVSDWIKLLFRLVTPKIEIDIVTGDPPISPSGEGGIGLQQLLNIFQEQIGTSIEEEYKRARHRARKTVDKIIEEIENMLEKHESRRRIALSY